MQNGPLKPVEGSAALVPDQVRDWDRDCCQLLTIYLKSLRIRHKDKQERVPG